MAKKKQKRWNRIRQERKLRKLTLADAAHLIGISSSALSDAEKDLPLKRADESKLQRWLDSIGRARIGRLEKLEALADIAASFPPGLAEAALTSLAKNASRVFEACTADDVGSRVPLTDWAESVQSKWERAGGLVRGKGHPDVE